MELEFKGDIYEYGELWKLHISGKKMFNEGEVIYLSTGEVFDIKDFSYHKNKYIGELVNDMKKLGIKTNSIKNKIKEEERLKFLEKKYKNKTIKSYELKELIGLKYNNTELKKMYSFSSYMIVNNNIKIPNLSDDYLGKFYKLCLLHLTHKDNMILDKKDIRSKPLTVNQIMDSLDIKKRAWYNFYNHLKKNNMITNIRIKDKSYLIINPVYVLNGKLTPINYILFKEDVDKFLPNIPQELKDLWEMEFNEIGIIDI